MTVVAPLHVTFRRQLREQALDAAHALTVDHAWLHVRMGAVASQTGVSRATLHEDLGDKQRLGEALVLRETDRFLARMTAVLEEHAQDVAGGVFAAVEYVLTQAEADPLLR